MGIYNILAIASVIMIILFAVLLLLFFNSEDPRKQGVAWSSIFGVGIGFCILIESVSKIYNI